MAYNSAKSYKEFADQLIIVEDGGLKSNALLDVADTYCYHSQNYGFTINVNLGWGLALGDYVFIVNSDTYIEDGDPRDLCVPGKITSPLMVGHDGERRPEEYLNGAFFVAPKAVTQRVGMLDQSLKTYFSDDDYHQRVKNIFQEIKSVKFRHSFGGTTTTLGPRWQEPEYNRDKKLYDQRYGRKTLDGI